MFDRTHSRQNYNDTQHLHMCQTVVNRSPTNSSIESTVQYQKDVMKVAAQHGEDAKDAVVKISYFPQFSAGCSPVLDFSGTSEAPVMPHVSFFLYCSPLADWWTKVSSWLWASTLDCDAPFIFRSGKLKWLR